MHGGYESVKNTLATLFICIILYDASNLGHMQGLTETLCVEKGVSYNTHKKRLINNATDKSHDLGNRKSKLSQR